MIRFIGAFLGFMIFTVEAKDLSKKDQRLTLDQVRGLQKLALKNEAVKINFQQKTFKSLRKKTKISKGTALLKKPSSFHWRVVEPSPSEWYYNGQNLIHYNPATKQGTRYSNQVSKGRELRELVAMVLDVNLLLARYKFQQAVQRGDEVEIILLPKKVLDTEKIILSFNQRKKFISQVVLKLKGGNQTTFIFESPTPHPQKMADFTPPKGVIIRDAL